MKKNESELFSGCSFLCYLTTTSSFFQKQINKICKASMVFLLQKQKTEQKKSQIILSKLESILPAIVVPSSWEKQKRDGVEILLTAVIFSILPAKPAHQKNKENDITIFFPTLLSLKVWPSNPTYLLSKNYSAQPENRSSWKEKACLCQP